MNLIEIYIQEVTRRLPEKSRKDIALELQSTIEDMLPDDYSETDVKSVLEKMGNPAVLAHGYLDRPVHLIGPRYFDVYMSLLKMILPIAAIVSFIVVISQYFINYNGDLAVINIVFDLIGEGIWSVIEVGIHTFFWLTVVFIVIERTDKQNSKEPLTTSMKKWTPEDLKNIPYIPKQKAITNFEVFGGLLWTAIWATIYFYANHLAGVYEGVGSRLEFVIPAFNQDVLLSYWPIVSIIIVLEIALSIFKLIKKKWTNRLALYNTITHISGTIVFIIILMNPNLFNGDFITYLADLFVLTAGHLKSWLIGGLITIFSISALITIYDGFRKSKIH